MKTKKHIKAAIVLAELSVLVIIGALLFTDLLSLSNQKPVKLEASLPFITENEEQALASVAKRQVSSVLQFPQAGGIELSSIENTTITMDDIGILMKYFGDYSTKPSPEIAAQSPQESNEAESNSQPSPPTDTKPQTASTEDDNKKAASTEVVSGRTIDLDKNLVSNTYYLQYYGDPSDPITDLQILYTLEVDLQTNNVRGTVGCNSFTGSLQVSNEDLHFDIDLVSHSKMACPQNISQQGRDIEKLLKKTDTVEVTENGALTFYSKFGKILFYSLEKPDTGTTTETRPIYQSTPTSVSTTEPTPVTATATTTPEPANTTVPEPTPTPTPTSAPTTEPTAEPTSEPETPSGNVFFVSPSGNDNNPGTIEQPWRSLSKAGSTAKAGDTVLFRGGTYYGQLTPANSGRPDAWIIFKAYPGETPIIISEGDGVSIRKWKPTGMTYDQLPSYIKINGFVIDGAGGKGIRIEHAHHIRILNNVIRNGNSAGISTNNGVDHLLIQGNVIHGNCNVTAPCSSGISIWNSGCMFPENCMVVNDGAPGYHIIIRNNKIYDNRNDDSACAASGRPTDGNGIIMDNNGVRNPQTLLFNNVIFHNGGMCVNLLNSGHIDVFHNSCYHNVETPRLTANGNAEFVIAEHVYEAAKGAVTDVSFRNNIVVGNGNATIVREWSNPSQGWDPDYTADYNIYFNGLLNGNFQTGPHDFLNLDPQYRNPSLNPAVANFRLMSTSPAINSGVDLGSYFNFDYFGYTRDGLWDMGAIEYTGE